MRAGIALCGLAHAGAAGLWCWLAPGGFPVGHPRWVVGVALPALLVPLGLLALPRRWAHAALASWTAMWCIGAVTALVLYDAGRFRIALGCVAPCAALLATCLAVSLVGRSRWDVRAVALALVGGAIGMAFPFSVRAPVASTTPAGGAPSAFDGERLPPGRHDVAEGVRVDTETAVAWISRGGVEIEVHPLLRLWSRSPDRGWTLFASPKVRRADQRLTLTRAVGATGRVRLFARGVAEHVMDVEADGPGAARIEAWSDLEAPEFAHQSSCARIAVDGLARPRIELSVAPGDLLDVLPYDYPFGRPIRFAAWTSLGVLDVVEASSGEKGPFRILAAGTMGHDGALTLTLHDGETPRARIVLRDFASQASTKLSPTAGWGTPQNDISFTRDEYTGRVHIHATWAGTGIGRGFDTAGHAAGTYRNRIDVEILR